MITGFLREINSDKILFYHHHLTTPQSMFVFNHKQLFILQNQIILFSSTEDALAG